ncbi:MAG: TonB-dependent receptor plug domain-containing protein [Bacteroidales bacterium]|jgi:hypothetical protein|nr:TonB-dependent receptor plug domain-containing protein [Bacteroidales bacterium]
MKKHWVFAGLGCAIFFGSATAQEDADSIAEQVIPEVSVHGLRPQTGTLRRLETKDIGRLPNPSANIETLLKTLPGVSSNNELSAQYSVRGGSFDENLVYVNGVEIFRPILIRSGQQEGLSFINPDLVSSVEFSAGGFDACYGDKMSSVLEVSYRTPERFAVHASASLLGASLSAEGTAGNKAFSYLAGARYKTSRYLLGTLDTKGDYTPAFFDIQGLFRYRMSDKWDADLLLNVNRNKYRFEPNIRSADFGTLYESHHIDVYYDGNETDSYNSTTGALNIAFRPSGKWLIGVTGAAYRSEEQETFDIEAAYRLSDLETGIADSTLHFGTGSELSHARNFLTAEHYLLEHRGAFRTQNRTVEWSAAFRQEHTDDRINEWRMTDSAEYVSFGDVRRADNHVEIRRWVSWVQFMQNIAGTRTKWTITAGMRFNYNNVNKESLFSPRISLTVRPKHSDRLEGHIAAGMYGQPPSYKELRTMQGQANTAIKAQRSVHYTVGGDYVFAVKNRLFRLSSEVYYKQLDRLIPYRMENVRIYYAGDNMASGYAAGWDIKLNGEFVKDAESWISLSLMKSRENIRNDAYGSFPLPYDQWANFNLFFQDYFPSSPDWRVFLNLSLGTPLPYHYPETDRFDRTFRMTPYRRVDIGLSKEFFKSKPHKFIRQLLLNAEIFNLFDSRNTISYYWLTVVRNDSGDSQQYAVPNYLTGRRFNIKLSAMF